MNLYFTDGVKDSVDSTLNNSTFSENNNLFYVTSTPKVVNGVINDDSGNDTFMPSNGDDSSPIRNLAKEQYMNRVNANTGPNTTTIIVDIEGEVKKKPRYGADKTYYIAKEILMTELTYKKDLDVINVVS